LQEQRELARINDVGSKLAQTVVTHWCKQRNVLRFVVILVVPTRQISK